MRTSAALLFSVLACTAPKETPQPTATEPAPKSSAAAIRTDRSRYAFRYGSYGPELSITTTFKAPDDRTVYVMNCNGAISTGLQRLAGKSWVDAWGAMTNSCLSPPIVIAPGAERIETILIVPGAGAVIDPRDHRELIEPGTYRATWNNVLTSFDVNARPFGEDLPLDRRVSAPFIIEAAPPRPALITSVEPIEGAGVARDTKVRIAFDFRRAPRSSPASLRLYVDGTNVTEQTLKVASEDSPPSHAELVFVPKKRWTPGRHGVKLELDAPGASYSWQFIVLADSGTLRSSRR